MANPFSTQQLILRDSTGVTADVLSKDSDPSAGLGTPAPRGSMCMRTDTPGVYIKTGTADTAWTLVGTMPSFPSTFAHSGLAGALAGGTVPISTLPAYSGDVSSTAGSNVFTIGAGKVSNTALAQIPASSVLGRSDATSGAVEYVADANAPNGQAMLTSQTGGLAWVLASYYAAKVVDFTPSGSFDNLQIPNDNGELVIFGHITTASSGQINGVAGGYSGRILVLRCDSTTSATVAQESGSGPATSRFYLYNSSPISLAQRGLMFMYSGAINRWLLIAQ
ncbi:MAG TPA: hypothetical protein VGM88_04250 [Kofleriaceae bacterium]|jgi:hypothetical protein